MEAFESCEELIERHAKLQTHSKEYRAQAWHSALLFEDMCTAGPVLNGHASQSLLKRVEIGGNVSVGGDSPITVQSMTNTLTTDIKGTIKQIHSLEEAGADIVRVSCPDEDSTNSLKEIIKKYDLFTI